jgi:hypothetical protein
MVATTFKKTQGSATRRKGAQGQGKIWPKRKSRSCWCLVSGRSKAGASEMGLLHQEQAAAQGEQKR